MSPPATLSRGPGLGWAQGSTQTTRLHLDAHCPRPERLPWSQELDQGLGSSRLATELGRSGVGTQVRRAERPSREQKAQMSLHAGFGE